MSKTVPPKLVSFPAAKQRRMDALLERLSDGTITLKEKTKLEQLVAEAEQLMVANGRLLAKFSQSQGVRAPMGAVPVTVWVQPETAEQ